MPSSGWLTSIKRQILGSAATDCSSEDRIAFTNQTRGNTIHVSKVSPYHHSKTILSSQEQSSLRVNDNLHEKNTFVENNELVPNQEANENQGVHSSAPTNHSVIDGKLSDIPCIAANRHSVLGSVTGDGANSKLNSVSLIYFRHEELNERMVFLFIS